MARDDVLNVRTTASGKDALRKLGDRASAVNGQKIDMSKVARAALAEVLSSQQLRDRVVARLIRDDLT